MMPNNDWTRTPPTVQGTYWHWHGHTDDAPVPMFVLYSGTTGKCFVSRGQLGLECAIDCDVYGGWWKSLPDPSLPSDAPTTPTPPADERWREARELVQSIIRSPETDGDERIALRLAVRRADALDGAVAACKECLGALTRWTLMYGDSEVCTEEQNMLVLRLNAVLAAAQAAQET